MSSFSDDERDRIREELIETGRELLLRYGAKKTNVADVTEPVGIAKSTFYRFFDSKGDLYLEIIEREIEEFHESVESALEGVDDPREGLERLFRCYREFGEDSPVVQQMVASDNYMEVFRNVSRERLEEYEQNELAVLLPFIESLQEESTGPFAEYDPTTVIGVMGTIGLVILHREEFEEFDEEYYDRVQDLLVPSLAAGLTAE